MLQPLGQDTPLLQKKESDKFINDCRLKGESPIEISEKVKLFSNWIGDHDDLFGSRIRITKREMDVAQTVYA